MSVETLRENYVTVEELIATVKASFPSGNLGLVRRACDFAQEHYRDLIHPTNKSYIQYAITVANYLAETGSAPAVVAAALICPPPPVEGKVFDILRKNFKGEDELLELVEEAVQNSNLEDGGWPSSHSQKESRGRKEIFRKKILLAVGEAGTPKNRHNTPSPRAFHTKEKQNEHLITIH